jgi:hypothetical protein
MAIIAEVNAAIYFGCRWSVVSLLLKKIATKSFDVKDAVLPPILSSFV